jgi:hypothetical protein
MLTNTDLTEFLGLMKWFPQPTMDNRLRHFTGSHVYFHVWNTVSTNSDYRHFHCWGGPYIVGIAFSYDGQLPERGSGTPELRRYREKRTNTIKAMTDYYSGISYVLVGLAMSVQSFAGLATIWPPGKLPLKPLQS